MSQFSQEELNDILQSVLKPTDTFTFTCAMCGGCCRKRTEPIVLNGFDTFRIAKALNMAPFDAIKKYTKGYVGKDSHLPLVVLDERQDGSCKLLHKGKCTVHDNKPIVCAIYPLGRFLKPEDSEFSYFIAHPSCVDTQTEGKKWTLQEWLDSFNIPQADLESKAWHSLMIGIAKITSKIPLAKISPDIIVVMFTCLYIHYNINGDFVEQVQANKSFLNHIFKKTYGKTIE